MSRFQELLLAVVAALIAPVNAWLAAAVGALVYAGVALASGAVGREEWAVVQAVVKREG